MSIWYDFAVVLILKNSVCPTLTLIDVAKPWIEGSPAPFTCQSLGGSPGNVFSHAITLTTGGPHGPAARAAPAFTNESKREDSATMMPMTAQRRRTCRAKHPLTDISGSL